MLLQQYLFHRYIQLVTYSLSMLNTRPPGVTIDEASIYKIKLEPYNDVCRSNIV